MAKNNPWVLRDLATGKASMGPRLTTHSGTGSRHKSSTVTTTKADGKKISTSAAKNMGAGSDIRKTRQESKRKAKAWGSGSSTATTQVIKQNPRPPLKSAANKKKKGK